jgi:hypothetical protein
VCSDRSDRHWVGNGCHHDGGHALRAHHWPAVDGRSRRSRGKSAKVNACRLLKIAPAIAERIRELQSETAKAKRATVETVVDELESARVIAERNEQPSAMVAASMGKARILGLEAAQKSEIGKPGDFSQVQSTRELAAHLLQEAGARNVTDQMRPMAIAELERHSAAVAAIVADDGAEQH